MVDQAPRRGQALRDAILDAIRQHPGIRPGELQALLGVDDRTLRWNLRKMRDRIRVEQSLQGDGRQRWLFLREAT